MLSRQWLGHRCVHCAHLHGSRVSACVFAQMSLWCDSYLHRIGLVPELALVRPQESAPCRVRYHLGNIHRRQRIKHRGMWSVFVCLCVCYGKRKKNAKIEKKCTCFCVCFFFLFFFFLKILG